jgi:high-affinity nickel permease
MRPIVPISPPPLEQQRIPILVLLHVFLRQSRVLALQKLAVDENERISGCLSQTYALLGFLVLVNISSMYHVSVRNESMGPDASETGVPDTGFTRRSVRYQRVALSDRVLQGMGVVIGLCRDTRAPGHPAESLEPVLL